MNRSASLLSLLVAACLLPAAWFVPVGAQSALPPSTSTWAITGVRIVDGSGNEPFEGTVVVRDGRIAEAGRSARPPDGAPVIDGKGKTVSPGLIDLQVQLPAGANDEEMARALAACAYAGVTTVAVGGIDPQQFDVLRGRLQSKGLAVPRLVAARVDGASAVDPGFARIAQATQRKPTALLSEMIAPTRVQKLIADETSGGDQAQWLATVDKLKALRASNTRLALASGTGSEVMLPYGWTTLLEARLLHDAGLTPLQVITAATSGGAWALGLQSDRGFLAVGQRADLVLFAGNPASSIVDIEKIERVFIAGQEIDRAAVRSLLTREEPPPPAPPTPTETTATNTSKAPGAGPTRGAAGRRGKRGAKADPPSASVSTSSSASPTNPAANPASPSVTPPPATGATPEPATPSPSTTTGSPAPTSPTADPAPAPGAGKTAATAATPAAAGTALENPIIDDFETNGDRNNLGASWQTAGDASTQPATIIAGRVIRGLRDHALHLTARMGDASQPYAAVNVRLGHEDGQPVDVSRYRGLRFEARGEGRYRIVFITRSVTDGRYHVSYFSGSPLWTPVNIPFASLGQNGGNGAHVTWTGRDVIAISFQVARDAGQMGWLELDNIRFY